MRSEGAGQQKGATASIVQWWLDCRLEAGHGEERTWNMANMSVTLEVSQLEMPAFRFSKPSKRELMSVIRETYQEAMEP